MKIYQILIPLLLAVFLIYGVHAGFSAGLTDIIKSTQNALGGSGALTNDEIIAGLKEALEVGTEKAVALVSQADGYYGNPDIKIPLPESVEKAEKLLRAVGYGETGEIMRPPFTLGIKHQVGSRSFLNPSLKMRWGRSGLPDRSRI